MEKEIIITDFSKMPEGVCVFGYDREYNGIRPVIFSPGEKEKGLPDNFVADISPFKIVKFKFITHQPLPPHTEDWLIDKNYPPQIIGQLLEDEQKEFLEKLKEISYNSIRKSLWGAPIYWYEGKERKVPYIKPGEGEKSIVTVKIKNCIIKYFERPGKLGKYEYRIEFSDIQQKNYDLSVTDLAFRNYCENLKQKGKNCNFIGAELQQKLNQSEVFLRIGAGRPFTPKGDTEPKCFLFITGVYSFPDYKK